MGSGALSSPPAFSGAAAARRAAASILHEGRFHQPGVPRPLHGVLHAVGRALSRPADALSEVAAWLGRALPGGTVTGWALVIVLLAAVTGLVARRWSLSALAANRPAMGPAGAAARASELARAADRAEHEERFAEAVRLRFAAGLLGLTEQRIIPRSETVPTREIGRRLESDRFDELADQFDAIAYGAAPAGRLEAERAREGWRAVRTGRR